MVLNQKCGVTHTPLVCVALSFADVCGARTEICVGTAAWALCRLFIVCSLCVALG